LIIDDPFGNVADAESKIQRDAVWQWYMSTALTRVQDAGIVLLCTTRWWSDDLFGRLQNGTDDTDPALWDFVTLPAIATSDDDVLGRKKGEPLWPEKRPLAELEGFRASMSEAAWSRGYQQICLDDLGLNRAYHGFDFAKHVRDCEWDGLSTLYVGVDYNVEPMSAVILKLYETWAPGWTNQKIHTAEVLDEISLDNSNTVELSRVLVERLKKISAFSPLRVKIFADATGNARQAGTEKPGDSNWKILCREMAAAAVGSRLRLEYCKTSTNPSQVQRVDLVNGLLEHDGLAIDSKCRWLIHDFLQVKWRTDRSGNKTTLDKVSDSSLTHLSDALGYGLYGAMRPGEAFGEKSMPLPGLTH
jgi:hypothetical protein